MSSSPTNAGNKVTLFANSKPKELGKTPIKMFKGRKSKKQRKKIKELRKKVEQLEDDLRRERNWRSAESDVHGCQVRSLREQLKKAEKYHQKWHQAETQSSYLRGRIHEMKEALQSIKKIVNPNHD